MSHLPRSWTAARISLAAVVLLVCWWFLMRAVRVHQPPRVLLLNAGVEGLDPAVGPGVARLLTDAMEVSAGATVLGTQPAGTVPTGMMPGDLLMKLGGRRVGDALSLSIAWTTPAERAGGRPWHELILPPALPGQTLQACFKQWPFPSIHLGAARLAPQDPVRFWTLMRAMSVSDDQTALSYLGASRELADKEPDSAAAWTTLGEQLYRSLWVSPGEASTLPQNQALDAFDHALALVPGYPRAAFLRGMMETDVGNQREALRGLVEARRRRPWVPDFYSGLAYAGRTSGLLDGAESALRSRRDLMDPLPDTTGWFAETTWLYTGQWKRFEESLQATMRTRRDPVFLFYLGYLALLHEDPDRAKGYFQEGASIPQLSLPFRDLCAVYSAALEGRREEGLARLRKLEESRGSLRIPDGELTFKVAEAYAFLGRPDMAIESAGRAFAQGFGCTRWYETSPIFAPAREHPRWAALQQHLRERQSLLEKRYEDADFKPAGPGIRNLLPAGR
ncbi:MAG TPA: hypothetical protein VJ483_08975 [Holophagaceae bacterium]|nr:hypothetical protein [Holophagaceae bacterium]